MTFPTIPRQWGPLSRSFMYPSTYGIVHPHYPHMALAAIAPTPYLPLLATIDVQLPLQVFPAAHTNIPHALDTPPLTHPPAGSPPLSRFLPLLAFFLRVCCRAFFADLFIPYPITPWLVGFPLTLRLFPIGCCARRALFGRYQTTGETTACLACHFIPRCGCSAGFACPPDINVSPYSMAAVRGAGGRAAMPCVTKRPAYGIKLADNTFYLATNMPCCAIPSPLTRITLRQCLCAHACCRINTKPRSLFTTSYDGDSGDGRGLRFCQFLWRRAVLHSPAPLRPTPSRNLLFHTLPGR